MGKVSAIVPAAGKGKRMGSELNKQYLMLGNQPILAYTLKTLAQNTAIDEIIVVTANEEINQCREMILKYKLPKITKVIAGGKERQHSVYNGLKSCSEDTEIVLIHDGARPLITGTIIDETIRSAREFGAVSVAVPAKDTIKIADNKGFVSSTPDRGSLWLIQTPQAFNYKIIVEAHDSAYAEGFLGTDDASLIENIGYQVKLIEGSYENIKITTPEDLLVAEAILARRI